MLISVYYFCTPLRGLNIRRLTVVYYVRDLILYFCGLVVLTPISRLPFSLLKCKENDFPCALPRQRTCETCTTLIIIIVDLQLIPLILDFYFCILYTLCVSVLNIKRLIAAVCP